MKPRSLIGRLSRFEEATLAPSLFIIAILFFTSCTQLALGQTTRGVIFGRALDPSGAVLAGVEVTATNLDNGATAHATTGSDGNYVIPSLLPAKYRVDAESAGFAKQSLPYIDLVVDARSEVDFTFQVAGSTTSVIVTTQAAEVDTGSASIGQVIEQNTISDLPLNGRDFLQLVTLSAGASPIGTGSAGGSDIRGSNEQSVNISGGRESSNQFTIDGVFDNAIHFEGLNLQPSIDGIQEFKVQRNTFAAEFGHGTAVVNLVTKSGGNRFHGSVFEFIRNDALDARQYFDAQKPPYRQNDFGVALGGPLSHNTFFFFDYEGFRARRSVTVQGNLPTADMLNGDFTGSAPITDPETGMPFPDNQIPTDRFSDVTQRILPFIPKVAAAGANNYVAQVATKNDFDQYSVRVDHRFSDRDSIFGRYSWGDTDLYTPGLIPLTGFTVGDKPVNATLQWTHAFSPTLLNDAVLGFNRNLQQRLQEGANNPDLNVLQLANINNSPVNYGIPLLVLAGYSAFGTSLTLPEVIGGNTFQYGDTVTWVKGKHTFKFGVDIRNTQLPHTPSVGSRGEFVFVGAVTGNPVADFLLGDPFVAVGAGKSPSAFMSMLGTSFFVQDDWIVSKSLTLNLGLRYDRLSGLSDRTRGRLGIFDPKLAQVVPPADVEKDGLVNPDNGDIGPRFGFAWQPFSNGKSVVRGGYGIYYDQKPLNEYNFSLGTELAFQQLVLPGNWDNLFPAAAGNGVGILTDDPFAKTPRVQQYSLGVQQELPWGLTAEAGYVGLKSDRVNGRSDINQAVPGPGTVASRRPYSNFGSIYAVNDSDYANYNSLQTTVQKRATRNLFLLAAYTYSRSLDIQSSTGDVMQNAHDIPAEYGPSDFNQKHRLSMTANWWLPFGRGQLYASGVSNLTDRVIGGWQVNGIYTYSTGTPFSVAINGVDASNTGTFGGGVQRANLVGPGIGSISGGGSVKEWFNTSAFEAAPAGTFGDVSRNSLTGPPTNNLDFSVIKAIPIKEGLRVDFRAEMFNIFNHAQFNNPVSDPTSPSFGQLTSVKDARLIQFGLKVIF